MGHPGAARGAAAGAGWRPRCGGAANAGGGEPKKKNEGNIDAVAWDWEIWTFALIADLHRHFAKLRIEYALINEDNGVSQLDLPSEPFLNNELVVQLELRF